MTDYRPIACEIYERYERAIMHRERLKLRWRDSAGLTHLETVVPTDLETQAGEEFLVGHTLGGEARRVRLDKIVAAGELEPANF